MARMWGDLTAYWWEHRCVHFENWFGRRQTNICLMTQRSHLRRNENIDLHKTCTQMFYNSFIHNLPKVGTTQMSLTWWIEKQILEQLYTRILPHNKDKLTNNLGHSKANSHSHYLEWKKPDSKMECIWLEICDSIYRTF